jgi:CHAT domain-containing protein
VRRTVVVDELRSSFFADRHRVFEAHVDLLMELDRRRPGEGWAERALAASEAGRARNLLDLLDRAGVDPAAGAPAELVARQADARHRLNALERRRLELAAAGVPDEELEAVAARVAETRWQAAWIEAQILQASPRTGELLAAVPPAIEEVRRRLAGVDLLLEIALGEERSFLWAVEAAGVEAFTLPGRQELEALARDAYRALSAPAADAAGEAALAALSLRLLAPVADRLARRRLLVVPDGALHLLPFAALPDPAVQAGEPRPLVAGHEIVQLPSAAALVHLSRPPAPRAAPRRTLAVFADPVFAAGDGRLGAGDAVADAALRGDAPGLDFQRLRFSRLEAEGLADLVPPEELLVVLDLAASRETLLATDLAGFRFLHFATHGVLDAEIPELSGLVLSLVDERGAPRDGFLRLHDVYRLDLDADLVTLSACRTALGREIRGEGLVGLTRGFLHAGARGVLASLWDVQDRATALLMESFYAGMLQRGLAPAAALRAAQLELAGDPRWRDPFFWAGFVLQAAPSELPPTPSERPGDSASVSLQEGDAR